MTSVFPRILSAALLVLAALGAGCTSPCETLADHICACKPNGAEQSACKEQVRASTSQHMVTPDENTYCSMLIDQCTCDALEQNDLMSCGFSKPNPSK